MTLTNSDYAVMYGALAWFVPVSVTVVVGLLVIAKKKGWTR